MAAIKLMILCALVIAAECAPGLPFLGEGIGIGAGLYPGGFGIGIGGLGGLGGLGGYGNLGYGGGYGLMGYKDKEGEKGGEKKEDGKPEGPIKLEPHNEAAGFPARDPISGAANAIIGTAAKPVEIAAGAAAGLVKGAAGTAAGLANGAVGAAAGLANGLLHTVL